MNSVHDDQLIGFHVYVNVNVLHVDVHHTTALLSVIMSSYSISLAFSEDVAIHFSSVHVNVIVHVCPALIGVLLGVDHVHTGAVLSTTTGTVLVTLSAGFHAVSFTLPFGRVNSTSQFTPAFAVYVNVNVFHVDVHHTTALLNVT